MLKKYYCQRLLGSLKKSKKKRGKAMGFKCMVCHKDFGTSKQALDDHLEKAHNGAGAALSNAIKSCVKKLGEAIGEKEGNNVIENNEGLTSLDTAQPRCLMRSSVYTKDREPARLDISFGFLESILKGGFNRMCEARENALPDDAEIVFVGLDKHEFGRFLVVVKSASFSKEQIENDEDATSMLCLKPPFFHSIGERFEYSGLMLYIADQAEWSLETFGPGCRTVGLCKHIEKELQEIKQAPDNLEEWIDVIILALDGAHRTGATPGEIVEALLAKQQKNFAREWPEPGSEDEPIEHVRAER